MTSPSPTSSSPSLFQTVTTTLSHIVHSATTSSNPFIPSPRTDPRLLAKATRVLGYSTPDFASQARIWHHLHWGTIGLMAGVSLTWAVADEGRTTMETLGRILLSRPLDEQMGSQGQAEAARARARELELRRGSRREGNTGSDTHPAQGIEGAVEGMDDPVSNAAIIPRHPDGGEGGDPVLRGFLLRNFVLSKRNLKTRPWTLVTHAFASRGLIRTALDVRTISMLFTHLRARCIRPTHGVLLAVGGALAFGLVWGVFSGQLDGEVVRSWGRLEFLFPGRRRQGRERRSSNRETDLPPRRTTRVGDGRYLVAPPSSSSSSSSSSPFSSKGRTLGPTRYDFYDGPLGALDSMMAAVVLLSGTNQEMTYKTLTGVVFTELFAGGRSGRALVAWGAAQLAAVLFGTVYWSWDRGLEGLRVQQCVVDGVRAVGVWDVGESMDVAPGLFVR